VLTRLTRTRLVDDVTDQLRRLILTDQLQPGQRLRQTELSAMLGVSRTPLREAFRVLEQEGLLRTSSANNTVEVIDHTLEEVLDLYEVREVVDGLAARLLAERGLTTAEARELEGYLRELRAAMRPYDTTRHARAHANFHGRIAELSGNSRVAALAPMVRMNGMMAARRIRKVIEDGADDAKREEYQHYLEMGDTDHTAIFEAIKAGDGRQAETLARRHIRAMRRSAMVRQDADDPR
jgi:GntR family transcriptional regulator of vanillate catabolism